jgi:polyphosphate kinase
MVLKCNSVIDSPMIEAIYRASRAGVKVDLIARGIVGLRPGLPGISDDVRVISIVGRFLEHARIYAFYEGDEARYYIGSADLMQRNLDDRVEAVAPVEEPLIQRELENILATQLADTALAWELRSDGSWVRVPEPEGEEPLDSQYALMERARRRASQPGAGYASLT